MGINRESLKNAYLSDSAPILASRKMGAQRIQPPRKDSLFTAEGFQNTSAIFRAPSSAVGGTRNYHATQEKSPLSFPKVYKNPHETHGKRCQGARGVLHQSGQKSYATYERSANCGRILSANEYSKVFPRNHNPRRLSIKSQVRCLVVKWAYALQRGVFE